MPRTARSSRRLERDTDEKSARRVNSRRDGIDGIYTPSVNKRVTLPARAPRTPSRRTPSAAAAGEVERASERARARATRGKRRHAKVDRVRARSGVVRESELASETRGPSAVLSP